MTERHSIASAVRMGVDPHEYLAAIRRGERICGGCRRSLPHNHDNFRADASKPGGRSSRCRECASAKKREYDSKHPELLKAQKRNYRLRNKERIAASHSVYSKKRNADLRAEMLSAYGGKCACCGEAEWRFLELDHVNNDGASHRKEVGNVQSLWLGLRRAGWPQGGFQLLCCNCNKGKYLNGGVCPHVARTP